MLPLRWMLARWQPAAAAGALLRMGRHLLQSAFARDAAMLAGVTAIERMAALVQTVLIARALGILEYGIYGLLFTSIGFVSSIIGLQMGLTATVLVAKYRDAHKARAAAVITHVNRFGWLVSLVFCAAVLPFAGELSSWLLRTPEHAFVVGLGAVFVAASMLSGVQDGIAQGFEDFKAVARARGIAAVAGLAAVYPAAIWYGLDGVVAAILASVVLKGVILHRSIRRGRAKYALPSGGTGVGFAAMVLGFSLPSMLASLLLGGMLWWGSFLLSRAPAGFADVALVNTGLQWRGPVLLLAASLGSVAVPVFSRLDSDSDIGARKRFKHRMLWVNGAAATLVAALIVALSSQLLGLYGEAFKEGRTEFAILVATTVPLVVANVYMQELLGAGRLWRQLWLHLPMVAVMGAGFAWSIPQWAGMGYAVSIAAASLVFLGCGFVGQIGRERLHAG